MSFRTAPSVQHRIAWVDKADKNSQSPETYDAMRKTTEREAKDQITKQINKYARKEDDDIAKISSCLRKDRRL